jgi:hypothetical protein
VTSGVFDLRGAERILDSKYRKFHVRSVPAELDISDHEPEYAPQSNRDGAIDGKTAKTNQ